MLYHATRAGVRKVSNPWSYIPKWYYKTEKEALKACISRLQTEVMKKQKVLDRQKERLANITESDD